MFRLLLVCMAAVLVLGASPSPASAARPPAVATRPPAMVVDAPARSALGHLVTITLRLPPGVAAVDGRIAVATGAASLIGVAPPGDGLPLMPVEITNGFAFGAYAIEGDGPTTDVRLVVLAERAGRLVVRIAVDAVADADGRRMAVTGTRQVVRIAIGGGRRLLRAPAIGAGPEAPRTAREPRGSINGLRIGQRDVDVTRGGWMTARALGATCGLPTGLATADANGDGCLDIVDVQALHAAADAAGVERGGRIVAPGPANTRGTAASGGAAMAAAAYARTFTVTSVSDTADAAPGNGTCADAAGRCTLRAAITEAERMAGNDLIAFNLPGAAPVTIQLAGALPFITSTAGTTTIDGYSQPGSRPNTATVGSNALPGVMLRGNGYAAREVGLFITSAGNLVRGLVIGNVWRGIFVDGLGAHDNLIAGNWIGYNRDGSPSIDGNIGITLNVGAHHNRIGTPDLSDRNLIGMWVKGIDSYGPGTDDNVTQNNVFCLTPSGFGRAPCSTAHDHDFGPKRELFGGTGPNERNVIGPTYLQGLEFSHGYNPALPPQTDASERFLLRDNRVIGNWVGFRGDGSYDPAFRSGLNASTADNAQGINVYDGVYDNLVAGNHIASVYDGIQVQSPWATGNVVRDNVIGESPTGQAAPLSGWGVVIRWGATRNTVENNRIRNAGLGGVGLLVINNAGGATSPASRIRISQNVVTGTSGPAIALFGAANGGIAPPVITQASQAAITGTAEGGSRIEIFHATRSGGASGLPDAFLGAVVAASDGRWSFPTPAGFALGDRVAALQIRPDNNTSALSVNMAVTSTQPRPPAITSAGGVTFGVGVPGSFTITSTGSPTPSLSVTGTLPAGVTVTGNGDGTARIAGTPTGAPGVFNLTIRAVNGVAPDASQAFTLVVAAAPAIASDGFGRTATGGWGAADTGGTWTVVAPAADYAVDGAGGIRLPNASATRRALLTAVSAANVTLGVRVRLDRATTGGGAYAYLVARRVDASNEYRGKLRVAPDGSVYLQATRVAAGRESGLGTEVRVAGLAVVPGDWVRLRVEVSGTSPTTVRIRAWRDGTAEPAAWTTTATDATAALQAAGAIGVQAYLSSSATNAPMQVSIDDFLATTP